MSVSSASSTVKVGSMVQLTAMASYSDGSSKDVTSQATWMSSNTANATVSSAGAVTGLAAGTSAITATFSGQSGSMTVTISSSNLSVTNLALTAPFSSSPTGAFLPLTAIATYSDTSTRDVTNQTTWSSSNATLATVSTLGVIHGTGITPSLTITGTFGGLTSSVSVSIIKNGPPSPLSLAPGDAWSYLNRTVQMTATYTPAGGTGQDVTSQTTWTSTNTAKATVDPTGLAHGLMSDGEVLITGVYQGNTASTLLTVSHAALPDNTPIMDMTPGQTYMGFSGNLYENNSNLAPTDHDGDGIALGAQIQPLDINGNPNPNGAIAFISLGLSNTSLEFKGFVQYVKDPSRLSQVNPRLAVLNGAKAGEAACSYVDAVLAPVDTCTIPPYTATDTQNQYDRVRDEVLATATTAPGVTAGCGTTSNPCLSEKQVQAIWLKEASPAPEESGFSTLCNASTAGCVNSPTTTEAVHFEQQIGQIVRAARMRYPNLKQVFLASRIYAGYIIIDKSPEVYAYEYGFSAKWAIQAQINQTRGQGVDPVAGDLNYTNETAPWLAWGPYLWADGANPRKDGLVWIKDTDYQTKDYQHPSSAGIDKVDGLLFSFFTTSAYTPWFRP
ncbi:MAG: Ig-like domain-containing protein [Candidatus Sulfotelmatobacter sp.]